LLGRKKPTLTGTNQLSASVAGTLVSDGQHLLIPRVIGRNPVKMPKQ
jgi:hypothetical protein